MSKKTNLKPLAIALGAAFVTTLATTPVANAAANPFAMSDLSSGYMVADSMEGKCGDGKCGASKAADKAEEGKCGEGKCGASKAADETAGKMKEGKCGEGKCGADKASSKVMEAKCGEGKCGGNK